MKLTDKFQMENNLKHILYGILATLALTTFAGCSRRIDYTKAKIGVVFRFVFKAKEKAATICFVTA